MNKSIVLDIDNIDDIPDVKTCKSCNCMHYSCNRCVRNGHICHGCGKIIYYCNICMKEYENTSSLKKHQLQSKICGKARTMKEINMKDQMKKFIRPLKKDD